MPWQCWQHKHPPNQNHPHPQLIRRRHRKLLSKCTNASQFLISSNALVSAVHNYISSICISSLDWPRQDGWRMLRCEKVEAEMEVRWRQDVFAILAWILLHHSMQWSSVEEIPCELQCRAMMQLWNARDNSAMFEVEHILKSEFKCIFSKASEDWLSFAGDGWAVLICRV